ncbi:MAG TPA: hypothetical protein VF783_03490, partial [Terriglobales bacterium]
FTQHLVRDRNLAPTQPLEALRVDAGLETLRVALRLVFVLGEKQHAYGQGLARTQEMLALGKQIIARNRSLNTDTVTALAVSSDGAAMREAAQCCKCEPEDFVLGTAVQGRNESNPAGFVIKAGACEALTTRRRLATTHSPLYMECAV